MKYWCSFMEMKKGPMCNCIRPHLKTIENITAWSTGVMLPIVQAGDQRKKQVQATWWDFQLVKKKLPDTKKYTFLPLLVDQDRLKCSLSSPSTLCLSYQLLLNAYCRFVEGRRTSGGLKENFIQKYNICSVNTFCIDSIHRPT